MKLPRAIESGRALGWPGATREKTGLFLTEEQRRAAEMPRRSNAAGVLPRAASRQSPRPSGSRYPIRSNGLIALDRMLIRCAPTRLR